MKNAETLNVITAIKLSDTDSVVFVGTDVNLLILLSKLSHLRMPSCVNLELVIVIVKYTIRPPQRLLQCQYINSKKKTIKLVHKHPELELQPALI